MDLQNLSRANGHLLATAQAVAHLTAYRVVMMASPAVALVPPPAAVVSME